MKQYTFLILSAFALMFLYGCSKEEVKPNETPSSTPTEQPTTPTEQPTTPIYPSAYFTYSIDNLTVTVVGGSSNAKSQYVEWGDGYGTTLYNRVSHTYSNAGTYTIRLTATSSTGHQDYATARVTVSKPVPAKVKITSLRIDKFPAAPSSGAWDVGGKPDVYFTIMDGNATVTYYKSNYKENVSNSNCPLYYNGINCTLYNITADYIIKFWDAEDFLSDELMASCLWTPSDGSGSYSSSDRWYNNSISMDFTISMTWYSASGEALYSSSAQFKDGAWITDGSEASRQLLR